MEQNRNIVKSYCVLPLPTRAGGTCGEPHALSEHRQTRTPARGDLTGWWSRRITQVHRLVYRMKDGALEVAQYRYRYWGDEWHRHVEMVR
jgi:YoeB-like toxin of bacterial type II toxin-antitoxin system